MPDGIGLGCRIKSECHAECSRIRNGESWNQRNSGIINSYIYAMASNDSCILAGSATGSMIRTREHTGGLGLFRSIDKGLTWTETDSGLTNKNIGALCRMGSLFFCGTDSASFNSNIGGVYVSRDNGVSWSLVNEGLRNRFINALISDGSTLYAGTQSGGVYTSPDSGKTWTPIITNMRNKYVFSLWANGDTLLAGTGGGVYISMNRGSDWSVNKTGLSTSAKIYTVCYAEGLIYAGTDSGIYVNTFDGPEWKAMNNGLADKFINVLLVDSNKIIAGTWTGVFVKSAADTQWSNLSDGLTRNAVMSICLDGTDYYCGAWGNGVWKRDRLEVVNVEKPSDHALISTLPFVRYFPNPSNAGIWFNVFMERTGKAELKIFDIAGKEIMTIFSGNLETGPHTLSFKTSNLTPGTYFYKFIQNSRIQAGKMIIIR